MELYKFYKHKKNKTVVFVIEKLTDWHLSIVIRVNKMPYLSVGQLFKMRPKDWEEFYFPKNYLKTLTVKSKISETNHSLYDFTYVVTFKNNQIIHYEDSDGNWWDREMYFEDDLFFDLAPINSHTKYFQARVTTAYTYRIYGISSIDLYNRYKK